MDLVAQLLKNTTRHDAFLIMVDRLSKLMQSIPCTSSIGAAQPFMDQIVCHWGLPSKIVSDYDPYLSSIF